jgi:ribosomal protein S18 acetylase RimI-like enzyme
MSFMSQENFLRMMKLAEEFFDTRTDPTQISVDQKVMDRLKRIHPFTMIEKRTRKGPVAWVLIIPTTQKLMKQFIKSEINERELLRKTPLHIKYDAIYLCSALVLPEYRRKGIAKRLMVKAIKSIRKDHPINAIFHWAFSTEGRKLAVSVTKACNLPLYKRTEVKQHS